MVKTKSKLNKLGFYSQPVEWSQMNQLVVGYSVHQIVSVSDSTLHNEGLSVYLHYSNGCIWPNGEYYVGDWKDNKRHGQGTHYYEGGERYSGDWRDDKWNGYGTKYYADGDRYTGNWKDNRKHGEGTFYFLFGDKLI